MLSRAIAIAQMLISPIDEAVAGYPPSVYVAATFTAYLFIRRAYHLYDHWNSDDIKNSLIQKTINFALFTPLIGPKVKHFVDKQITDACTEIKQDVEKLRKDWKPTYSLPDEGASIEEILAPFKELQKDYHHGQTSGAVYADYSDEEQAMLKEVWGATCLTNPLHNNWPAIHGMKADIISWCQTLLNGQPGGHGIITHGGSSSILEACKAYVLHSRKLGIHLPEIIIPTTAHVAFDKAAKILNAKLIKIPVDPKTGRADVEKMEKAITSATCMLVASAPSYPFGVIDPISALGSIANKHKLPLHVDACLGGFITVFAKEAGFDLPSCDFSDPNVTSISIDTHKFGQSPKGTSVLVFNPNFKPASSFDSVATPTHANMDWDGGVYVTDTIDGSRAGADFAVTWAILKKKGKAYYVDTTKKILELQAALVKELNQIDGIYVPYQPQLMVVGIRTSPGINPLLVAQKFEEAHWSVNLLQKRKNGFNLIPTTEVDGFHFCLTAAHICIPNFINRFVTDMKNAVHYAKAHPNEKPRGIAKVYGALSDGIPSFIQDKIGDAYAKIQNSVTGVSIPGFWQKPKETAAKPSMEKSLPKKLHRS